jgi:hypothetical protein
LMFPVLVLRREFMVYCLPMQGFTGRPAVEGAKCQKSRF